MQHSFLLKLLFNCFFRNTGIPRFEYFEYLRLVPMAKIFAETFKIDQIFTTRFNVNNFTL